MRARALLRRQFTATYLLITAGVAAYWGAMLLATTSATHKIHAGYLRTTAHFKQNDSTKAYIPSSRQHTGASRAISPADTPMIAFPAALRHTFLMRLTPP